MRTYTEALDLHAQDYFPFPTLGKIPAIAGWQRGRATATKLARWFGDRPDANLGLRTGNGIFAVDLDLKHDGELAWRDFVAGRTLPDTATALTGSGGKHLVFRAPAQARIGNAVGWLGLDGVDIRGRGGFIVVEPSIHPDTGREYVWLRTPRMGVAKAPRWLLDALLPKSRYGTGKLEQGVGGDAATVAASLIERYPIAGPGRRGDALRGAVPSAVGRGFDDRTTIDAVLAWWSHHYERGLCSTPPNEAEVSRYISLLRKSDTFTPAVGRDHRDDCRKIDLPDRLAEALRATPGPYCFLDTVGVTSPLCRTADEAAFIEAIVVHALHEIRLGRVGLLKFTRDQIRQIVADRHAEIAWANVQFERLKRKYIDREGMPASRASLLRQVETGNRAYASKAARPSSYEPTGLMGLLEGCGIPTPWRAAHEPPMVFAESSANFSESDPCPASPTSSPESSPSP